MFQKLPSLLVLAIILLCGNGITAQDCKKTWAKATAPSGLILRKAPGKGYLDKIPLGDTLSFCSDSTYGKLTFDKINGFWRKVQYKGKTGYSFDGFLEPISLSFSSDSLVAASKALVAKSDSILGLLPKKEEPTSPHKNFKDNDFQFLIETYNYCGNVQALDLELFWYGVFLDSELNPTGELSIRPLKLNISLSGNKSGSALEFDILTTDNERSLFLFGLNNAYPYQDLHLADVLPTITTRAKRLFPGQEWLLNPQAGLKLSATGSITKAGPCPEAKDYTLVASRGELQQDLKELLGDYGTCSIPEIYWYGDISGDGLPEIIFVSVREEQNVFTLLQSETETSQLFSLKSVFTVENCAQQ